MQTLKQHVKAVSILIVLQLLIDVVFRYLYPTVNPIRATLIAATAFVILWIPWLREHVGLHPILAVLPIFVNALIGALSVQWGLVVSRSVASAVLHVWILIMTYETIMWIWRWREDVD